MATLVCYQSGNLTSAIWRSCAGVGEVDGVSNTQAASTSYVSSPNFSPGAVTASGIVLFIAERAGTTGTLDVSLYNATDSVEVAVVSVSYNDLRSAGWHYFAFSSPVTLVSGKNYNVRIRASGNNQVYVYTSGTTNDWCKALVLNGSVSPASNDKLHIARILTGSSVTTPTVTMDNTNTTLVLGPSVSGNWPQSPPFSITIAGGCELVYGTAASTNYILKLNGSLLVGCEGVFRMGSSANPIPASSTAILEFQVPSANQTGLFNWGGTVTIYGSNPTLTRITNLTANAASGQPVITVADVTGWTSGDPIMLSPSRPTVTDWQEFTVSSISGNNVTLSANLTVARDGTGIPEVGGAFALNLRNFNVILRSQSSSNQWVWNNRWRWQTGVRINYVYDIRYASLFYLGSNANNTNGGGIGGQDVFDTGMKRVRDSIFRSCLKIHEIRFASSTATYEGFEVDGNIYYQCGTSTSALIGIDTWNGAPPNWKGVIRNCIFARCTNTDSNSVIGLTSFDGTVENCTLIGSNHRLFNLIAPSDVSAYANTFSATNLRRFFCGGSHGFQFSNWGVRYRWQRLVVDGIVAVRCNSTNEVQIGESRGLFVLRNPAIYGATNAIALAVTNSNERYCSDLQVIGGRIAGESATYPVTNVLNTTDVVSLDYAEFIDVDFKAGNGVSNLLNSSSNLSSFNRINFENCKLPSGLMPLTALATYTAFGRESGGTQNQPRLTISRYDQQANDWRWYVPFRGGGQLDFTTFRTSAPSERIFPRRDFAGAYPRLRSTTKFCTVAQGQIATVKVWVRKSASGDGEAYNGQQPSLVIRHNTALGASYRDDVVLATATGGAGTWEKLEASLPAAAWDTVIEVWVECDGTAGWLHVDDWDVAVA
jgi:hypothetical protein